jgi:hypothetical protein
LHGILRSSNRTRSMLEMGHERPIPPFRAMSVPPPECDQNSDCRAAWRQERIPIDVGYLLNFGQSESRKKLRDGPKADSCTAANSISIQ